MRQHEALRVPEGWTGQEKALVVQLERILTDIYQRFKDTDTTYDVVSKDADGLAPQLPDETATTKFLRQDASWATPPNTEYSEASSSAFGLVKTGYTQDGQKYPVALSDGKMYCEVPWTDTWRGYQIVQYTAAYETTAGGNKDLKAEDFDVSTPSGYTPVAIAQMASGNGNMPIRGCNARATGTTLMMRLTNKTSSVQSGTAEISILYLQTSTP